MKLALVMALFLSFNFAQAQERTVNLQKCEYRIKRLGNAAFGAGQAWAVLDQVRNQNKDISFYLSLRDLSHEEFLKAQAEAISCLYE